ncbi:hypothetical protein [Pseudoalteromonas virus vB_PspP-H6/1]|nr:hypothetical protein [Pseudoalteromonas virus vB_PspP-H6/1]
MGKIMEVEANQIREEFRRELRDHKNDQKEVISALVKNVEKVGDNIEKLTDAVSRIESLHVEVNSQNRRLDQIDEASRANSKEINDMGKKLAVADSFVTSVNRLQYGVWGALIIAVIFAAFQVSK